MGYVLGQPSALVILLFLVSSALMCFGWWRLARALSVLATMLILLFGLIPTGYLMLNALEERFPRPSPTRVDGVVVLGGSFDSVVSDYRGHPELNAAADRVTTLIQIVREFPAAQVIYADGGAPVQAPFKEADAAAALLRLVGIDTTRMYFERNAINTRENATTALALAQPLHGHWLLVTSAWHMPRAVAAFRGVGWDIEPFPVDYLTHGGPLSFAPGNVLSGLGLSNLAIKEWVGLGVYYLKGWSADVFPAPRSPAQHDG